MATQSQRPPEREPVMDCRLVLTALSGATINVSLSIAKFDRFEDLEDHVMDYLVSVTDLKVFECSIDFLHMATQTYLEDPIWDKLQHSMEYCIIFKDCSEVLPSQELLEGCPIYNIPLAVHVPMNPEGVVPEGAFAGVPRLRRVSIESGIRLIGPEVWQSRRQLRIVKMPATVVGISDNAFRNCKLLNSVTAPGCREFGYKAFAECCSLQWVYAAEGVANQFSSTTKFGHYLFRGCINPSQTTASDLALGCLSSTGITTLTLTQDFAVIGAHACDNCHLLKKVDLSNTQIEEIQEFTFVRCTSLKEVSLPPTPPHH